MQAVTPERLARLMRVTEFQRAHPNIFRTEDAVRYHLARRHKNGLIEAGAVVETRFGPRIDPMPFLDWCFDVGTEKRRA